MPIQLSASVVGDSHHHTDDHPNYLHADEFLRLCVTQFPESTLALGWATSDVESAVIKRTAEIPNRYNWTDVKLMYDLIEKWQVKQPITLVAHAKLARYSLAQLKWLMEMTGATLTLQAGVSESNDATSVLDLLYIRHRLPVHSVFYDTSPAIMAHFGPIRDDDERVRENIVKDGKRAFVADQWHIVKSRGGETIYLGSESVLLQTGLLITKVEYAASVQNSVIIEGRVEFLEVFEARQEPVEAELITDIGLAVFLRATQSSRPDSITGIRCFMGITGMLKIETRGVPGADLQVTAAIPGTAPCFKFIIVDQGADKISLNVSRPKSCNDWSKLDYTNFLNLPMKGVSTEASYIAIRQSLLPGSKRSLGFTAVDEFTIHTSSIKSAFV